MFNFFKDYFKSDARFITRPNFIFEYESQKEGKVYTMDKDLLFWTGKAQIAIRSIEVGGIESAASVFHTNFLSIPKFLRGVLDQDDERCKLPSALHDGLYGGNILKRVYADWIFLLAMKSEGVEFWKRWGFFFAVRIFGRRYYG